MELQSSVLPLTRWSKVNLPEHERPSPANPPLQVQLCPPTVLVQFAFTSHSWFPVMHSSISTIENDNLIRFKVDINRGTPIISSNLNKLKYKINLPKHERPSPANPSLQEQLCPPTVLVQFAFTSQSWLPVIHSSTSTLQTIKKELF